MTTPNKLTIKVSDRMKYELIELSKLNNISMSEVISHAISNHLDMFVHDYSDETRNERFDERIIEAGIANKKFLADLKWRMGRPKLKRMEGDDY